MKLGAIGLGIMGEPMAGNLLDAGHDLIVWNRSPRKMNTLVDKGASAASSPADVVRQRPEVVLINVTDTPDVEAVLFGEDGLAAAAQPGLIVVDHSTISPVATQRFAKRLADDHGVTLIDAPVSGGDVGAQQGTLSIMVGGPDEAVAKVRPLFDVVGRQAIHLGPAGMGQACKACNQVAVAGALLGAVEALSLAHQLGLDADPMIDVVGGGAGGSWQLTNLGPKVAAGDHAPGFMVDYLRKDLNIVADTAQQHGLELPLLALARQLFEATSEAGDGSAGTQAVAGEYARRGGFSFS
jgi:3-hydroxyisobutyrate dehydrogenase